MNNLVNITNGQVVISSRQVAESFEKKHHNVIKAIESLQKDVVNFNDMFL